MPDSKAISVRIPSQLLDSLDAIAEKDYRAKSDGKPNRSQVLLDALEAYIEQRQNENTSSDDIDTAISKEELENALDSERKDMERIMDIEIHKAIKPALDKIYEQLEALESAKKQPREAEQR
jgi:metal-responsive CopG/Arc/MetJ family transcriptional regulator